MSTQPSKLEPAYSVIRKFDRGGRSGTFVLSQRLGIGRSAVTKWTLSKRKSGTGGFIPAHYYSKIMSIARELGISLTAAELTGLTEFDRPGASCRARSGELPLQAAE